MKFSDSPAMTPEVIQSFTWIEKFAHFDSYEMLQRPDEDEIGILDELGVSHRYATLKKQSADKGLIFEILKPLEVEADIPCVVYVTFPGVRSKETLLVAWQRAPGNDCFQENVHLFLDTLDKVLTELKTQSLHKMHIVLIGHSLGGAYAQLAFHALQQAMVNITPYNHHAALTLGNIASLTLGVWNAAGVIADVAKSSLDLAHQLSAIGLQQRAFYGCVEGDILQTLGQGVVLCGAPACDAELHLIRIDRQAEWIIKKTHHQLSTAATHANLGAPGMLASLYLDLREKADSHSTPTLHTASKQQKALLDNTGLQWDYYQNNTPEGQAAIIQQLKRSVLLNTSFMQWCRRRIYATLCWWIKKK